MRPSLLNTEHRVNAMTWLVTATSEKFAAPYLDWLRASGVHGVAVWPGRTSPDSSLFDALLLAGGGDVAPGRYGAVAEPETANVNELRDEMEIALIAAFRGADKPVFGICRGIQVLNVALGGGLIQHIPRWLGAKAKNEIHSPGKGQTVLHAVTVTGDTALGRALSGAATVSSFHHQAIAPDRLAPELKVVCLSPAGIIEAVESAPPDGRISAVQWHPERLPADHPASQDLLQFWVEVATQETG